MHYLFEILPSLLAGTKLTLSIFGLTLLFSLPLGLVCALGRMTHFKILSSLLRFYIWLMRGTPLLLQLIFVFYGLPLLGTGIVLPRYTAALVAFILNYTAYFAEIFRGGLQAIDPGQVESAKVLRFNYWQTITHIIAPQVMKIVIPSIGNEVINLIKDSSLVYVIGLGDLLRSGNVASCRDVTLVPLVMVGVIYLALTALFTKLLQKIEAYYGRWK